MSHQLVNSFQDQFAKVYIYPFVKLGDWGYVHLGDLDLTRAEDIVAQLVG